VVVAAVVLVGMIGLALVGGLSAFSSPDDAQVVGTDERRERACDQVAVEATRVLQAYVDQFSASAAAANAAGGEAPAPPDLRTETARLRVAAQRAGCDPEQLRGSLERRLAGLVGDGPVAAAVAARLRASVLGLSAPLTGPRAAEPVEPGEDLAAAVAAAPSGATVVLAPGVHHLDRPLVLLSDVRLQGDGAGTTRLESTAEEAAVLAVAPVRLAGLTVAHSGEAPASVVVAVSARVELEGSVVTGGTTGPQGAGGHGVVLLGASGGAAGAAPSTVTDSEITGNDTAGLLVLGGPPVAVRNAGLADNGGCGICFLGDSSGTLTGGSATGNGVGVLVAGTASPELTDLRVEGNTEAGVLLEDRAAPSIVRLVAPAGPAVAVLARGRSAGALTDVRVSGRPDVALAVSGDSSLRVEGGSVSGGRVGLQVDGSAAPVVQDLTVETSGAAVLVGADAGGVLRDLTCSGRGAPVVLLPGASPDVSSAGCRVVRGD
jgi:hypothetical protein